MPIITNLSESSRDTGAPSSRTTPVSRSAPGVRRVLVCLDRSACSEACLPHAVSLARVFDSTVTLLHVMQPVWEHSGARITDPLGWEVSRREASAYLERLAGELGEAWKLRVDCRVEQGRPAERITAIARQIGADLTVIASHGEGGLAAWSLGSTAQQVLAVSRGSVLVVRAASPAPSVVTPHHILVPLDGSLRTESVLPTAARIADAHGADLLLVHVVVEPLQTAMLHAGDLEIARDLATRLESRAKRYLEHVRGRLPRDTKVRTLVTRHVDERQSLLEISSQEQVDLVVLSAHGSVCNPARPFGSVTHHLLAHSTVPLLVLQDLSEPGLERIGEEADEQSAPPLRASYPPGQG
jgi:nucleotide-binding universal stress UspA family protein